MRNHLLRGACGTLFVLLFSASSVDADMLYLSQGLYGTGDLHRLDSESPGSIYPALFDNPAAGNLRDIHLDPANDTMYWSVDHPSSYVGTGLIYHSDLDGNGTTAVPITTTLGQIYGLTVDPTAGLIFFSTFADMHAGAPTGLMSVPITGGPVTPLLTHGAGTVSGVVADPATQKLYAALNLYSTSNNRRVVRMDYDGGNVETIYDMAETDGLGEIEIDIARNRLAVMLNSNVAIGSLDGTAPLLTVDPALNVYAFALSNDGQQVFFSNTTNDKIYKVNMDSTGEALIATVFNTYALEALIPEPASLALLSIMAVGLLGRRSR